MVWPLCWPLNLVEAFVVCYFWLFIPPPLIFVDPCGLIELINPWYGYGIHWISHPIVALGCLMKVYEISSLNTSLSVLWLWYRKVHEFSSLRGSLCGQGAQFILYSSFHFFFLYLFLPQVDCPTKHHSHENETNTRIQLYPKFPNISPRPTDLLNKSPSPPAIPSTITHFDKHDEVV